MSITASFRRFIREFRSPSHSPPSEDSLSRTIRESTHAAGGTGGTGGVTSEQVDIITKGHESYDKSFKDQSQ